MDDKFSAKITSLENLYSYGILEIMMGLDMSRALIDKQTVLFKCLINNCNWLCKKLSMHVCIFYTASQKQL